MPLPCPPRSSRARRALASSWLLSAGVWLFASACGPGVATPMPEPPAATAFDLSGIAEMPVATAKQPLDRRVLVIEAASGNVPQGATIRVTNLDTTDPVVAGISTINGGFEVDLIVTDGQELRFEWVSDTERSAPADAIISRPDPNAQTYGLRIAPRFDCLKLSPGFVLDFDGTTHATLGIENACTSAVQLANPRSRVALTDFALPATVPATVPVGESTQISVDFTRATPGIREDVLFLDVTLADTTIRYPITLRAE
jgi:hypothetical protein